MFQSRVSLIVDQLILNVTLMYGKWDSNYARVMWSYILFICCYYLFFINNLLILLIILYLVYIPLCNLCIYHVDLMFFVFGLITSWLFSENCIFKFEAYIPLFCWYCITDSRRRVLCNLCLFSVDMLKSSMSIKH